MVIRIEFQDRGYPHAHMIIWAKDIKTLRGLIRSELGDAARPARFASIAALTVHVASFLRER